MCLVASFSVNSYADQVYMVDPQAISPSIHLSLQQKQFTLALKSNPTTGFSWQLKSYDTLHLHLIDHHYQHPTSQLIGAPGMEYFRFAVTDNLKQVNQAKPAGTIRFSYARPWEKPASSEHDLVVTYYVSSTAIGC